MNIFKTLLVALVLLITPMTAQAQDEAEDGTTSSFEYVELQPPFLLAYGGPGPLRYLKTEVILVVQNDAIAEVKLHTAPIRHNLVMLLSRQTQEAVNSAAGREKLRKECLESVREVLVDEYGETAYDNVKDLLFTSFVVQD